MPTHMHIFSVALLASLTTTYCLGAEDAACRSIQNELQTKSSKAIASAGPEKRLGTLCGYGSVQCNPKGPAISLADLKQKGVDFEEAGLTHLLDSGNYIDVRRIDINNDGRPDLRLVQVGGTDSCQANYFFVSAQNGSPVLRAFDEFRPLTTEGAFCDPDQLVVRRIRGANYLVAITGNLATVFRGQSTERLKQVCAVKLNERWGKEQREIEKVVRQKYPDMPSNVEILRPTLERLKSGYGSFAQPGEMLWSVVAHCNGTRYEHAYAIFWVHPRRLDISEVVSPGGQSSFCD